MTAPATAFTLCEQVGRLWAANSTLGLTFAEPRSAAQANIYATPMPPADRRLSPCVSITPEVAAPSEAQSPTRAIGIALEVHAATRREALAALEEIHLILFPDDRPYAPVVGTIHGQSVVGTFGAPPASLEGEAELWRIIELQPVQIPTVIVGGNVGRNEEGEEIATATLRALAVRQTLDTPTIAFRVWVTAPGDFSAATIEVDGTSVKVVRNNGSVVQTIFLFSAYATIALLRAAIDALEGVQTESNAEADALASADLELMSATNILGRTNATDLVVGV
ncbi:MAG: hypothetical protein KJZ65_06720 [Phycisphaerales bacterium]|nr:hypothetical protein [Phycisphaerales bacterium]